MKMSPILLAVLSSLLALVGTACFDNSDPAQRANAVKNVTGDWEGSTSRGEPVLMSLNQTLVNVEGKARIGAVSGNLTGTVDGNRLEGTIQTDPVRQIFANVSGTPDENTGMSGTVRDITGGIISNFDAVPR